MATPSESPDNKAEKLVVIYVPALTISHLFSSVELGELLAAHSLGVSIVVCGRTADTAAGSFAEGLAAAHPQLSFHLLPHVTRPRDVPAHDHVAQTIGLARASDSDLREFLRVASPSPSALVLDFFCGSAVDVGAELGIPTYFFFTSSISGLAELLYHAFALIHEQASPGISHQNLGGELLHVPGIPPISVDDFPAAWHDRDSLGNRLFLTLPDQMCSSHGIVVNSFRSLEPRTTDAIVAGLCTPPGRRTPPLHCVGPVIKKEEAGAHGHECLAWLDAQPEASVVFLCFGSMGRLSAEQTRHVARGLEMSGQRFLWVRRVLAHGAVGGFVTHCGWNSVLEAIMGGVPMLAWPMYAEQRMNKVFLVEELRLAVALEGYDKEMVKDEEVAAKVKWLMETDGGGELRERARAAMREAKKALSDGGESSTALLELVRQWKM
ncbi:UDP-glycosyltransferase 1 [Zea mays]|uniref:UDP-glycosyltransferase 1 n=1 Tax=Zea mays TaxID=4577 RepID=A0A3L6DQ82_MAIZE|nr:UDP-glycosyltransferase 1 [Zea mays]